MGQTKNIEKGNRSKIGYLNYEDMLLRIESGQINSYDIIFSKDRHVIYLVSPDLKPIEIKARVYVFDNISEANASLNKSSDTYEGQIVSILNNDTYKGYIVNKDKSTDLYYVSPLHELVEVDYNTIGNKPIINMIGTLDNPIEIASLQSGIYSIIGEYRILNSDITKYSSANQIIFMVNNDNGVIKIKKIATEEIVDYTIEDNIVYSDKIITEIFLKDNKYCTEKYVDEKLAALDIITRDEIKSYVDEIISEIIDDTLDKKIDVALNKKIQDIDDQSIINLF